jgi:hypothetical protein
MADAFSPSSIATSVSHFWNVGAVLEKVIISSGSETDFSSNCTAVGLRLKKLNCIVQSFSGEQK